MSIYVAKLELDNAIQAFLSSKSKVAARISESANAINKKQIESSKQNFDIALKNLNKYHTIWRCCYEEEHGYDNLTYENYSSSWLEDKWEEYSILDDQLDEILYSCSTTEAVSSTMTCITNSSVSSDFSALAAVDSHSVPF